MLGHTDNPDLIFLILPRLLSSQSNIQMQTTPIIISLSLSLSLSSAEAVAALSSALYPHPLIALSSSNLITALVQSAGSFLADYVYLFWRRNNRYLQDVALRDIL